MQTRGYVAECVEGRNRIDTFGTHREPRHVSLDEQGRRCGRPRQRKLRRRSIYADDPVSARQKASRWLARAAAEINNYRT